MSTETQEAGQIEFGIEEVLHILADGISLTAAVREKLHEAIAGHFGTAPEPAEPAAPADPEQEIADLEARLAALRAAQQPAQAAE